MTDDAAVAGQHGNLEAVAALGDGIVVDVAQLESEWQARELGNELVAERAAGPGKDEEPFARHRRVSCGGRWWPRSVRLARAPPGAAR